MGMLRLPVSLPSPTPTPSLSAHCSSSNDRHYSRSTRKCWDELITLIINRVLIANSYRSCHYLDVDGSFVSIVFRRVGPLCLVWSHFFFLFFFICLPRFEKFGPVRSMEFLNNRAEHREILYANFHEREKRCGMRFRDPSFVFLEYRVTHSILNYRKRRYVSQ